MRLGVTSLFGAVGIAVGALTLNPPALLTGLKVTFPPLFHVFGTAHSRRLSRRAALCREAGGIHDETLITYKLGSKKFTTQNDLF